MILRSFPLRLHWPTLEPFLFCAHHLDHFPKGEKDLGLDKKYLQGRPLGNDFELRDGYRMYHGHSVPGFPVHPHRGFETITIVRRGFVDHADSLGAGGRYGEGDVQWMTAGSGVQHSEMFPLLQRKKENVCELFQIWLNLPMKNKLAAPHYKMFWSEKIPKVIMADDRCAVTVICGDYNSTKGLEAPPQSWAADGRNDVKILIATLKKGGTFRLPPSNSAVHRVLYFFSGTELVMNGQNVLVRTGYQCEPDKAIEIHSPHDEEAEVLILEARPIGEPVFQHGPFVMNTREEIIQAIDDFRRTGFGGWPWPREDMVHGEIMERFARFPDGRIEKPSAK